jgi:hypothetical protein
MFHSKQIMTIMKIKNIKYVTAAMLLGMSMTSCSDFLDRPVEDNYNTENFYSDDASCISGVNYLYNSPWYDFQRGFIKVGEVLTPDPPFEVEQAPDPEPATESDPEPPSEPEGLHVLTMVDKWKQWLSKLLQEVVE